jgi:putative Holliday junction resolvase
MIISKSYNIGNAKDCLMDNITKILGFDFGLRRIGVAVGQRFTGTASPVTTLLANDGEPNWQEVSNLITTWQPQALLVGMPLNMDGSISVMATRAEDFAKKLETRFNLTVFRIDERLSTFEAKSEFMRVRGQTGMKKGQKVDAFAAVILVEAWLGL